MSALLNTTASEINVCAEYGYSAREFTRQPRVMICQDYKSCLMLVHYQSRMLPNRQSDYRNHFTLFRSKTSILVVRVETTLVHNDNDAVLTYDRIRVSDDQADRMRASKDDWDVSFDRNVEYSNMRPDNFTDYELIGSGEWWFFDRGVILNGVTKYVEDSSCLSLFIYYELHPKFVLRRVARPVPPPMTTTTATGPTAAKWSAPRANTPSSLASMPIASQFLYMVNDDRGSIDDDVDQNNEKNTQRPDGGDTPTARVIPSLDPRTMTSLVNATSRPLIRSNEQVQAPDVQYQSVVPSLFWLKTRNSELCRCDISYFLPQNYRCAYGPIM